MGQQIIPSAPFLLAPFLISYEITIGVGLTKRLQNKICDPVFNPYTNY